VVEEVEDVLDRDTVDELVEGVTTILESVTTESPIPGTDSLVVVTVVLSHLGIANLTQEEFDELKAGLSTVLDFGDVATRRYLQAGFGLELIEVGDATIVTCPAIRAAPCIGTASKVTFSTMPISTSAPTVKSGKGSKSGRSNSGSSKAGKNSKSTSPQTLPGVITSPTMKSGKGGKGRMRI
jgi:hypothetical protein